MSREAKIIIFSLILVFSYFIKNDNKVKSSEFEYSEEKNSPKVNSNNDILSDGYGITTNDYDKWKKDKDLRDDLLTPPVKTFPTPKNGFSPYDNYVGKGIYNNNSGNEFEIKNSNSTHAVVLLVNAYNGKKVRNEFIRKGSDFLMTGVPNGTYYLQWFSGDNWSPELKIGGFTGGFQTNQSFTKTRDMSDWMKVDGYMKWTVTLYAVQGGDVESESINPAEFLN